MIETPPIVNAESRPFLRAELSPETANLLNQINDDYLYWSDIKYRTGNTGLTPSGLWNLVKQSRMTGSIPVWPDFNLHFSLTNKMQRLCHEFDLNFGGSWGGMKLFPQDKVNQELYLVSSIMEEAISSSRMEGASTTREVAKEMLRNKTAPKNRSQRMILNNYRTIQFISDHKNQPLTPEMLLQVHSLMTEGTLDNPDEAGKFRTHDRIVVGDGLTGEIVHRPPSFSCLKDFAIKLCDFFNGPNKGPFIHPIIRALIVHFLIAYYHPFVDGNGRTARALFYWYMLKENYWLMEYLSISRIIYRSKTKYEKSFLYTENDGNDIGYFITYNLNVLTQAFNGLKAYLQKKQSERKKAARFMHLDGVSTPQSEIIRMFYDEGDIHLESKDVARRFKVSRVTAKSYLDGLVEMGILNRKRLDGRTYAYVRSENFDVIINL